MKVIEIYKKTLTNKNYSENTIESYTHYLEKFLSHISKNPYHINVIDIKVYLLNHKYSSISQQNQIIGSLKLFARYILGKKNIHLDKIERPKKVKSLPKVIDGDILKEKILSIENTKHKAILSLGYSCALRVSEVVNLKMCDIDRERMIIHIRNSKGRKDRMVKLSNPLLKILDIYYEEHKPIEFLFNGQSSSTYSPSSCNKLMKKHIGKDSHFHLLRHSSATTMHENGLDIMVLSKFLGHNSVKTTQIYTHVSNKILAKIEVPI